MCKPRLHDAPFQLKPFQRQNEMFGASSARANAANVDRFNNFPMSNATFPAGQDFQANTPGMNMHSSQSNAQSSNVFPPLPPMPVGSHQSDPASLTQSSQPNQQNCPSLGALPQSHAMTSVTNFQSQEMVFSSNSAYPVGTAQNQMTSMQPISTVASGSPHGIWGCSGCGATLGCDGGSCQPCWGQPAQQAQHTQAWAQQTRMQTLPVQEPIPSVPGHMPGNQMMTPSSSFVRMHTGPTQQVHQMQMNSQHLQDRSSAFAMQTGFHAQSFPGHSWNACPMGAQNHNAHLGQTRWRSRSPRPSAEARSAFQTGGELV